MSAAGPLEQRLLRLFVGLKVVFWTVAMTTLMIGIWNTAAHHDRAPPMALIWSLPLLAGLQLGVWVALWRMRRVRLRGGAA